MKVTKKHIISLVLLSFFCFGQIVLFNPGLLNAAGIWDQQEGLGKPSSGNIGSEAFGITSPSDSKNDVRVIVAKVLKVFLGMMGIIFVVLIFLAGFKYMNAQGNDEKTKEALKQIQQAVIGLLIIVSAFGITVFVEAQVRKATTDVVW